MPLRFAFWLALWLVAWPPVTATWAAAQPSAAAVDEYFLYPVRPGESLGDIARVFHVSVQDLTAVNHLAEVDYLQIGQIIRVPNGFARETAELRAEQVRLLEGKRRMERESAEHRRAITALQERDRQLEAEKQVISAELAAMNDWRSAARIALGVALLALGWVLKMRIEQLRLAKKHAAVEAENAALIVAKERYRRAVAQLELRYQKLYGGSGDPSALTIQDGIERMRAAFSDGSAAIERQLERFEGERVRDRESVRADARGLAWMLHSVRGFLGRHGLKYHTP